MKKAYTRKQIQEAISYWRKQLVKGNYRKIDEAFDRAGGNPYDLDNCKVTGYVAYFTINDDPFLPVDFSMPITLDGDADEVEFLKAVGKMRNQAGANGLCKASIDLCGQGGARVPSNGTFFGTRQQCEDALRASEMDAGGAQTVDYLYDCQQAGIINEQERKNLEREFDKEGLVIYETFVCGNGAVIFGRDALNDNADEWDLDNNVDSL